MTEHNFSRTQKLFICVVTLIVTNVAMLYGHSIVNLVLCLCNNASWPSAK